MGDRWNTREHPKRGQLVPANHSDSQFTADIVRSSTWQLEIWSICTWMWSKIWYLRFWKNDSNAAFFLQLCYVSRPHMARIHWPHCTAGSAAGSDTKVLCFYSKGNWKRRHSKTMHEQLAKSGELVTMCVCIYIYTCIYIYIYICIYTRNHTKWSYYLHLYPFHKNHKPIHCSPWRISTGRGRPWSRTPSPGRVSCRAAGAPGSTSWPTMDSPHRATEATR